MISLEYIAGFFDADGSCGVYVRGKNSWQINACIANSGKHGRMVCEELSKRYSGCLTYSTKAKKETHRDVFWWRLNGAKTCKKFFEDILPYSIIKKDQIAKCLEFIEQWDKMPKHNKTKDQIEYIKNTSNSLKQMKKAC